MPAKTRTTKKKKKKGHTPAHQNTFAFTHNPKSKLTAKILASPNVGVCRRCHDKIEWRKKYRKYKPLTKPGKCNLCERRGVVSAAYHTICSQCAVGAVALSKIAKQVSSGNAEEKGQKQSVDDCRIENGSDNDDEYSVEETTETNDCAPKNETPSKSLTPSHSGPLRACAICVREPALPEDEGDDALVEKKLQEEITRTERRLGRTLKLRERKGLERRVKQSVLGERGKSERNDAHDANFNNEDDNFKDAGSDIEKEQHLFLSSEDENDGEEGLKYKGSTKDGDDLNDPFLAAVGGADKLLVGDAYRKMLLDRNS